ncbi:MAG: DNRLRE domain-containing protein [Chloroflexota bacterium]|nr:MAG: DNRLRE domain-containing protein [Chloroflexota bacterium]
MDDNLDERKSKRGLRGVLFLGIIICSSIFFCLSSLVLGIQNSSAEEFVSVPLRASSQGDYSADRLDIQFQQISFDLILDILRERSPRDENIYERATVVAQILLTPVPSVTPKLADTFISSLTVQAVGGTTSLLPASELQEAATIVATNSLPREGELAPTISSTSIPIAYVTQPVPNSPQASLTPRQNSILPATATRNPSPTVFNQPTSTPSATATLAANTFSPSSSSTPALTGTVAMTIYPTSTNTPTLALTASIPTATNSLTVVPSLVNTATENSSGTSTSTATNVGTSTPTEAQSTPLETPSNTPVISTTPVANPSQTATPFGMVTPTSSPDPSTPTPIYTLTVQPSTVFTTTPSQTSTSIPLDTSTAAVSPSSTLSGSTNTPTITPGFGSTPTASTTPQPSPTYTFTASLTPIIPSTDTPQPPTITPTITSTVSDTPTLTPTDISPICFTGIPTGILPSDDTYIRSSSPNSNFGSMQDIEVRPDNGANRRGLIRFNLSSIPPGSKVTKATLYLFERDRRLEQVTLLYKITSPWDEDSATWNFPWLNPGGDFNSSHPYASFPPIQSNCILAIDLTVLVQEWVNGVHNYGFLLYAIGPNHILRYSSKENTVIEELPRLQIDYIQPASTNREFYYQHESSTSGSAVNFR